MTQLLQKAIAVTSALPETQQDTIAQNMLEEIAAEAKWESSFARSQDALSELAAEALAEDREGKTKELDPSEL